MCQVDLLALLFATDTSFPCMYFVLNFIKNGKT